MTGTSFWTVVTIATVVFFMAFFWLEDWYIRRLDKEMESLRVTHYKPTQTVESLSIRVDQQIAGLHRRRIFLINKEVLTLDEANELDRLLEWTHKTKVQSS